MDNKKNNTYLILNNCNAFPMISSQNVVKQSSLFKNIPTV